MDPKYVQEGSADKCAAVDHACSGLFCGCTCHGAERARISDQLEREEAELKRRFLAAVEAGGPLQILPPSRTHVPDASQLRGRIAVMINLATSEPGHRMSLPMVALGNEIWHTVVAFLHERGVDLGDPEQVEQSLRWSRAAVPDPLAVPDHPDAQRISVPRVRLPRDDGGDDPRPQEI